jgi:membrane-associated phospholipid phosphatase
VNGQSRDQRVILLVSLLFLIGFLLIVTLRSGFVTLDLSVNTWAASVNKGSFTVVAEGISVIFDATALTIISVVVAAVFFVKNHRRYGVLLLGAMGGATLLVAISKALIISPRPLNELVHATDHSFPSGHVTGTVVFFGILTYFAWKNWTSAKTKASTGGFYAAIIVLIGFDRIYLDVHWFSDVVGGFLLGAFWLMFALWVFLLLGNKTKLSRFNWNAFRKRVRPNSKTMEILSIMPYERVFHSFTAMCSYTGEARADEVSLTRLILPILSSVSRRCCGQVPDFCYCLSLS